MGDLYEGPLRYLIGASPVLLAELIGLIVAVVLVRRHTKSAVLVIGVTILMLAGQIGWPFAFQYMLERGLDYELVEYIRLVNTIVYAACWLLLVTAVFIGRGGALHSDGSTAPGGAPPPQPYTHQHEGIDVNVKAVSKGLYLGSIFGALILAIVLLIPAYAMMLSGDDEAVMAGAGIACFSYLPMIFAIVMLAILVYKMWAAIQAGPARTTPGKAVGFLFIPFFNFYWIFQAYWGWTVDYNRYIEQAGITAPRAPQGLALTLCVLTLCTIIPLVGLLISLINIVLMVIFLNAAVNGINAIAAAAQTPPAAAAVASD